MVSSELGACEWFVWDLRRSGLIDRGQLDQVVGEFLKKNPRAEPPALAEYLVSQAVLSPFQAERILQSKTQGLVLGPYVLLDTVGSGSMGQVYRAQSKTDSQWYAVKVLPRRSMWNVRLARRQVRAFGQFTHPTVVPFVDVGTAGGQHYLVWPFVEGETLEARVLREGKLSPEGVAILISQVSQGLALAHGNGIFHGLLKPSNILIGTDGQPKILDFGIGSLLAENEGESLVDTMSTANTLTSGLDCSSPESIMEPTNRTPAGDQYSLGCVLYFALAGQYPFPDGTAVEKMMAHQFKQPTPLREVVPHVADGLAAVVDRLMQKSPDGRYSGADEIVEALLPFTTNARQAPGGSHHGSRSASSGGSHHGSRSGGSHPGVRPASAPAPAPAPAAKPAPAARPAPPPAPAARPTPPAAVPVARSAHPPAPAPVARPAPAVRPAAKLPASSAQVPTPSGGPLTPVPAEPAYAIPVPEPSRAKAAAPRPPAPKAPAPTPAVPTRGTIANKSPSRAIHVGPGAGVVNNQERGDALPPLAPVWADPPKGSAFGPAFIFFVAAIVTGVVYLLAKNFLFAES